jgi:hypothetical protein
LNRVKGKSDNKKSSRKKTFSLYIGIDYIRYRWNNNSYWKFTYKWRSDDLNQITIFNLTILTFLQIESEFTNNLLFIIDTIFY